jgi:hypothetical protein
LNTAFPRRPWEQEEFHLATRDDHTKLAEAGVEPSALSAEKSQVASESGAESGALPPDLVAIARAWKLLSAASKAAIVSLAREAMNRAENFHSFLCAIQMLPTSYLSGNEFDVRDGVSAPNKLPSPDIQCRK